MTTTCASPGCTKEARARGWCKPHYDYERNRGLAPLGRPDAVKRFWDKVAKGSGDECWLWTGRLGDRGYVRFQVDGRLIQVHRFAYELLVGPIPVGLTIDHLCRVRHCVNPSHLEPVTVQENLMRGESPPALNARKTHCPQNHPYDSSNPKRDNRGRRVCIECRRERDRAGRRINPEKHRTEERARRGRRKAERAAVGRLPQ